MFDNQEPPREFFEDISDALEALKDVVEKYGMEERWTHAFVGGIYTEGEELASGKNSLKTVLDYVVQDEEELDEILSISAKYYQHMESMEMGIPADLSDTEDWTSEDWIKFIEKNTQDGSAN
tara:strand:- start:1068 stop:1433 length:366 start_codon:yes stop_codon:yes gene_type:complete